MYYDIIMENIIDLMGKDLAGVFKKLDYDTELARVTFSDRPDLAESDFQCNAAFALAKRIKVPPIDIAKKIAEEINQEFFQKYNASACLPGFVNLEVKEAFLLEVFHNLAKDKRAGIAKAKGGKILIDYGGANVAKPMHVGHLRPAVIGESLKRIARFMVGKNQVKGDVHLGDWGLQMGLTIAGLLEEFGEKSCLEGGEEIYNIDNFNRIYPAMSRRSKEDKSFHDKAQSITVKLQSKAQPYYSIWQKMHAVSIADLKAGYASLNTDFDFWLGESDASELVPKVISLFEEKGLTRQSEGATIIDVSEESDTAPMPPIILKSSAGGDLYATTDLATILHRKQEGFTDVWYVTDFRQKLHFQQVFRATEKVGLYKPENLFHLANGTLNGTDGKPFKTREGGVMRLSDLVEILSEAAQKRLAENGMKNTEKVAKQIGISALRFGDLSNDPVKDVVFDVDKFTSFEGKTGPYILYAMVRIQSVLKKIKNIKTIEGKDNRFGQAKPLLLALSRVPCAFQMAFKEKKPYHVANVLYDLAKVFSAFYNDVKVIKDNGVVELHKKIYQATLNAMKICTDCLAIDVPSKM